MTQAAEYVREAMTSLGMKQEELAAALGITQSNVNHILRGRQGLSHGLALKLEWLLTTTQATHLIDADHVVPCRMARSQTAAEWFEHLRHCGHCLAQTYRQRTLRRSGKSS